jgi:hypothetical protein
MRAGLSNYRQDFKRISWKQQTTRKHHDILWHIGKFLWEWGIVIVVFLAMIIAVIKLT